MAEKTTKKNTKGTKKVVEKKATKKVATKKATPKKVVKETTVKEEVKVVTPKETKKEGKIEVLFNKIIENKPFAISLCVIVILLGALIFTICDKRIPKTKDGKQVLASVKGKKFTADDLYIKLKDASGTETLVDLIDSYIVSKEVKLSKDDEEYIQDVFDSYKSQAESYGTTLEVLLANMYGLRINSEDEFYDLIKNSYSKGLAVEKYIGDNASEKELKEYYEENYSDELTVRHILIQIDEDEDDAYEEAMDLIKELNDTNKDNLESKFKKLAEENSADTGSANDGGLVENVTKKTTVSEFFEAASKLKDGEYTKEPVKTSYGYHIIYRISSTPLKEFKKMKDQVKTDYARDLLNSDTSLQTTKWDELRKSYKLKIYDTDVKKYYEEVIEKANKTED